MTKKHVLYLSSILLLLVFYNVLNNVGAAQTTDPDQQRREMEQQYERKAHQRADALFKGKPPAGASKVFGRAVVYSLDRGFGNSLALLAAAENENVRKEFGLSDEQTAALYRTKKMIELAAAVQATKYVDRMRKMDESDHKTIRQDLERDFQYIRNEVAKVTTEEMQAKARKLNFQALGGLEAPLINPDAVGALDLTDEQKEKIRETFKKRERERLEQLTEGLELFEKAVQLGGADMSPEDRRKFDEQREILEARFYTTSKQLADELRAHLTGEQLQLEKRLLAERPDFLGPLPRQLRDIFEEGSIPGWNSWRPGQGVPDNRRTGKQNRRPFPITENTDPD